MWIFSSSDNSVIRRGREGCRRGCWEEKLDEAGVEVGGGDSLLDLGLALDVDLVLGLGGPRYLTGQEGYAPLTQGQGEKRGRIGLLDVVGGLLEEDLVLVVEGG